MMGYLACILLGVVLAIAGIRIWDSVWSFRAQDLQDYAAAEAPNLADVLGRKFEAHGLIYDYSGRVKSRFLAEIEGEFDAGGGRLAERFSYASGETGRREWTIRFHPDGRSFTATAPDVVGEGKGELRGDAIRMTYRLKLPERVGGHVVDVVDWLYLMADGAIVNRSEMRKFGFKAAELVATFRPVAREAALPAAAE